MSRLTVIGLILITGCTAPSDRTELRVWDWWSPVEGEKMRDYFRVVESTFEQVHPDLDLRYQHIPFGPQYIQKIMAGMAAGRPPDALHASIIWANDLYERGVLMDLKPFLDRTPEFSDAAWLPAALRYGRDGGYVYGIPIEQDAMCIVYNLDLFEQAGIDTDPFVFKSWEDLRRAARAMTRYDQDGNVEQSGFMVDGNGLHAYLPWMYADGGAFFTPDLRRAAFNDVPLREAMQFLQDLLYRDRVSFPVATQRQDFQLFFQGKVAMFVGGTWFDHLIKEQAPGFRYGMMSFPPGPHGRERGGMTWTNLMCIPKGAPHPEQAWEFIRYYCGMPNALTKLTMLDRTSPLAAFYESPEWKAVIARSATLALTPHITGAGGLYPVVRYTEIDALFKPLYEGLMLNNLTPEQVIAAAHPKVETILTQYYAELDAAYR